MRFSQLSQLLLILSSSGLISVVLAAPLSVPFDDDQSSLVAREVDYDDSVVLARGLDEDSLLFTRDLDGDLSSLDARELEDDLSELVARDLELEYDDLVTRAKKKVTRAARAKAKAAAAGTPARPPPPPLNAAQKQAAQPKAIATQQGQHRRQDAKKRNAPNNQAKATTRKRTADKNKATNKAAREKAIKNHKKIPPKVKQGPLPNKAKADRKAAYAKQKETADKRKADAVRQAKYNKANPTSKSGVAAQKKATQAYNARVAKRKGAPPTPRPAKGDRSVRNANLARKRSEKQAAGQLLRGAGQGLRGTTGLPKRTTDFRGQGEHRTGLDVRKAVFNTHLNVANPIGGYGPVKGNPKTFGNTVLSGPKKGDAIIPGSPQGGGSGLKEYPVTKGGAGWTGRNDKDSVRAVADRTKLHGVIAHPAGSNDFTVMRKNGP